MTEKKKEQSEPVLYLEIGKKLVTHDPVDDTFLYTLPVMIKVNEINWVKWVEYSHVKNDILVILWQRGSLWPKYDWIRLVL